MCAFFSLPNIFLTCGIYIFPTMIQHVLIFNYKEPFLSSVFDIFWLKIGFGSTLFIGNIA